MQVFFTMSKYFIIKFNVLVKRPSSGKWLCQWTEIKQKQSKQVNGLIVDEYVDLGGEGIDGKVDVKEREADGPGDGGGEFGGVELIEGFNEVSDVRLGAVGWDTDEVINISVKMSQFGTLVQDGF